MPGQTGDPTSSSGAGQLGQQVNDRFFWQVWWGDASPGGLGHEEHVLAVSRARGRWPEWRVGWLGLRLPGDQVWVLLGSWLCDRRAGTSGLRASVRGAAARIPRPPGASEGFRGNLAPGGLGEPRERCLGIGSHGLPGAGEGRGAGTGRGALAGLCREQGLTDRKQRPLLCLPWAELARRQQATRSPGDDSSSVALLQVPTGPLGRRSPAPPTGALLQPQILSHDPTRHGTGSCERLKSCGSSMGAHSVGVTWPQGSPDQNTERGCQAGL